MTARIGRSDRQLVVGFVAGVVVVDYLKLRLPKLIFGLMNRVAGVTSNHCVLPRLKDAAQRPGQQSGAEYKFASRAEPQDHEHEDAEPLRRRKRAEGKDRQPQPAD